MIGRPSENYSEIRSKCRSLLKSNLTRSAAAVWKQPSPFGIDQNGRECFAANGQIPTNVAANGVLQAVAMSGASDHNDALGLSWFVCDLEADGNGYEQFFVGKGSLLGG